ncbi:hypothetical protein ACHAWF_011695 [Thalassiosira exigua]
MSALPKCANNLRWRWQRLQQLSEMNHVAPLVRSPRMISSWETRRGSAVFARTTSVADPTACRPQVVSRRLVAVGSWRDFKLCSTSVVVVGDFFPLPKNTFRHGVLPPLVQSRRMNSRPRIRLDDCASLGELIHKAHEHLEALSIRDIAAFWTEVSKFLRGRKQTSIQNSSGPQLKEILLRTLLRIGEFPFRDLTQTTLALAKIISQVENSGGRIHKDSAHGLLHDRLIGNRAQHKQLIFEELVAASMPILHEFDERHLSNLIYAFGLAKYVRVFEDESTNFDEVAIEIIPRLETTKPRDLSNILWAYANAGAINHDLFVTAADVVIGTNLLKEFNSQDMSNMIWATFEPQAISNIVWAYATAGPFHSKLFKKVAHHIVQMDSLRPFKPQNLSNTVWAYATASESHPNLFEKVADHIDCLWSFEPQALSNTVWAFATVGEYYPTLFEGIADHIVRLDSLRAFNAQGLANIVWAYATAGEYNPKLFMKVADHIVELDSFRPFEPQQFSNIVWAYAAASESHPELFRKIANHMVQLDSLRAFNAQGLSNTAWAYTTAKVSSSVLFKKLSEVALNNRNEFNSQNIANFLWAAATNGHVEQHLFRGMASTAASLLNECNIQELANLAWAYAVADVSSPLLFNNDFINDCVRKEGKFTREELYQLHRWNLWQLECESGIQLPPSLRKKCYDAFISEDPTPSALQDDVILELSAIGLNPEEEVLTKSGYRIDALVEVNGNKVAIEVDGPFHFVDRCPTGSTILKHRQVAILEGFPVISVPYWEWDKLKKERGEKQHYLRSLLGLT